MFGAWGCGACQNCRKGMENYCLNVSASGPGLSVDGGMAEYLLVPATRYLVPLGDMSPVEAAPLTDAGLTPYHAIKAGLHLLVPGSYAVVIGAGGLGHLAVQFLKALSPATVICVDQRESALEVVAGLGADHTVVAGAGAADEIRGITGGRGAEMVLDICGYDDTLALAAAVAAPLGRLTIVGVGGGTLPVNFFGFPYECSVQSTYWGSITELGELLALAGTGNFRVHADAVPARPGGRGVPVDGGRHPPGPGRPRPQRRLRPHPPRRATGHPRRRSAPVGAGRGLGPLPEADRAFRLAL